MIKKYIYIILFVFLGILLQFLVHSGVEMLYIHLLQSNFETWSFGLSWADWWRVHNIATVILLLLGIAAGFWAGKHFWEKIYGGNNKMSSIKDAGR